MARRELPLRRLESELKQKGVKTRVIVQDLSEPGAAQNVFDTLADLDLGLLVSNAQAGKTGGFLQNLVEDLGQMLRLNVIAPMESAHYFASRFRHRRRRGGILLVSSTAGLQPVALGANCSSAKAFVTNLGKSLSAELRPLRIDVSVVVPGPTNTPALMHRMDIDMSRLPMPAMKPEAVVKQGLSALVRQRPSHTAGWLYRWMARLTPRRMSSWVFSLLMRKNTKPELLPEAPISQALSNIGRRIAA